MHSFSIARRGSSAWFAKHARVALLVALCCLSLATSCAGPARARDTRPHAVCNVCRCEGDLACVDVRVDAATPSLAWHGKTYYFCSNDCRSRFQEHPETFTSDPR